MTLTFIDLYNKITGQAWSMFDGDVESQEEFETNVTTSIQKALSDLWGKYPYPFKIKTKTLKTKIGNTRYSTPNGTISKKNNKYNVKFNNEYLEYNEDVEELDQTITGEVKYFNVENDNFIIYPIPDKIYTIYIDYETLFPCCNKDGTTKATLENADDYIDIPAKYEELFKNALITLAMTYLIASDSDENFSQYKAQAQTAYERLIKATKSIKKDKRITY